MRAQDPDSEAMFFGVVPLLGFRMVIIRLIYNIYIYSIYNNIYIYICIYTHVYTYA